MSAGDDLEVLMTRSGLMATQGTVEAVRLNAYADAMRTGNWTWLPINRRNPIIVDAERNIMSGHHRLVAAHLAGVDIPDAAIVRFPGVTARTPRAWSDVSVI